jgi:hypothetical protein
MRPRKKTNEPHAERMRDGEGGTRWYKVVLGGARCGTKNVVLGVELKIKQSRRKAPPRARNVTADLHSL